jgi:hypothetical protein
MQLTRRLPNVSVDSIKPWAEYVPLDAVLREQWP